MTLDARKAFQVEEKLRPSNSIAGVFAGVSAKGFQVELLHTAFEKRILINLAGDGHAESPRPGVIAALNKKAICPFLELHVDLVLIEIPASIAGVFVNFFAVEPDDDRVITAHE